MLFVRLCTILISLQVVQQGIPSFDLGVAVQSCYIGLIVFDCPRFLLSTYTSKVYNIEAYHHVSEAPRV